MPVSNWSVTPCSAEMPSSHTAGARMGQHRDFKEVFFFGFFFFGLNEKTV